MSTSTTTAMDNETTGEQPAGAEQVDAFLADLERQGKSPHTVRNYRADVHAFARWFDGANHEDFEASLITPTDVREYRGYLQATRRLAPATVNRHLASLRAFAGWAVVKGLLDELPTAEVTGAQTAAWEPRWLDRKDERALVRAVERYGNPRDVAIIVTLLQTGLRVDELVALELGDVELSSRKGAVTVRQGKRGRYREVPLNADARRVIERYLAVRPASSSARLLLGQRGAIGPEAVQRVVRKYARHAQLEEVTPHLRQTGPGRRRAGGDRRSTPGTRQCRDDGHLHPARLGGSGGSRRASRRLCRAACG